MQRVRARHTLRQPWPSSLSSSTLSKMTPVQSNQMDIESCADVVAKATEEQSSSIVNDTCDINNLHDSPVRSPFQLFSDDTTERNLSGLLQLPDIDDASMAHVFAYIEHYQEDFFWGFLSDSFFLFGGIAYVALSLWDYIGGNSSSLLYKSLMVLGPLVYLVNSIVDIIWANRVSRRSKVRRRMQRLWNESSSRSTATIPTRPEDMGTIQSEPVPITQLVCIPVRWCSSTVSAQCHRIRRHAAHRRTVLAALTFGAAALAAFVAVLIDYSDGTELASDVCNSISIHMYIVSAIISVTGKRTRPWLAQRSCLDNHENLEDLGDLFFLIGSVMDGVLCDSSLDDNVALLPVLSSLLWLLDACFYLLSDFVLADKFGKHYVPGAMGGSDTEDSEDDDAPRILT